MDLIYELRSAGNDDQRSLLELIVKNERLLVM